MEQKGQEEVEILRGVVRRVTFRNPETGYAVLKLKVSDQREEVTVVGLSMDASEGSSLVIRGNFISHQKFGRQFNAQSMTLVLPSTSEGIQRYLGSGLIKGIGEKTAERLVEAFGEETLNVIQNSPDKVAKIAGIGRHKAKVICAAFQNYAAVQEVMRFLVEHGISPNLSGRIYEQYKERSVEVLKRDPYVLARQMRGVGFLTADQIARSLGLSPDAPQRLKAGLFYALEKARDDGHCYLPVDILLKQAQHLLGLAEQHDLSSHLASLIEEAVIVQDGERLYLTRIYEAEQFVASFIADRCNPADNPGFSEAQVQDALRSAAAELKVTFSAEQEQAVRDATRFKFLVITGGPGCGKTTVIRALTSIFRQARRQMVLAAPTGRAAQRMSQVCGMEASTIHRLLKYDPMGHRFFHGINNPIQVGEHLVDVVIIDESSMIDVVLAKDLFSAIPKNATVILVGDKDQLPSVGPGRVFAEILSIPEIRSIVLSRLFRRAEESMITTIAHSVNSGIVPEIPEPDGVTKTDAYFIHKRDAEEAVRVIESLVSEQIPKKFGIPLSDILVLTPSNRGPLGTIALNQSLQNRVNPAANLSPMDIMASGDGEFRLGDRVCQRVNNYNIHPDGVFNGDLGRIVEVFAGDRKLHVEMWDGRLVEYDQASLSQLSLAYSLTVHRSQGSEIPCVVLALHESHFTLLERQLLYTAVTRAKRLLIVVGSKKALSLAARKQNSKRRLSGLSDQIKRRLK